MKYLFLFIGLFIHAVVPAKTLFMLEKSNARVREAASSVQAEVSAPIPAFAESKEG